jgi:hypothetical protein
VRVARVALHLESADSSGEEKFRSVHVSFTARLDLKSSAEYRPLAVCQEDESRDRLSVGLLDRLRSAKLKRSSRSLWLPAIFVTQSTEDGVATTRHRAGNDGRLWLRVPQHRAGVRFCRRISSPAVPHSRIEPCVVELLRHMHVGYSGQPRHATDDDRSSADAGRFRSASPDHWAWKALLVARSEFWPFA